jgi:hypothetical protein
VGPTSLSLTASASSWETTLERPFVELPQSGMTAYGKYLPWHDTCASYETLKW